MKTITFKKQVHRLWTDADYAKIIKLKSTGLMDKDIAKEMNTTPPAIWKILYRLRENPKYKNKVPYVSYHIENKPVKRYIDYLKIPDENVMVIGDTHLPYCNYAWLNLMLDVAVKYKIKILVVVGNLLDSAQMGKWMAQDPSKLSLEEEFYKTRKILVDLLKTFDKIYILTADCHENRGLKFLRNQITAQTFSKMYVPNLKDETKIEVSNYAYCIVGNKWRLTHPDKASARSTTKVRTIAEIHQMNTISLHSHIYGEEPTLSGKLAVQLGAMTDKDMHEYSSYKDTSFPNWRKQFCMIKNNYRYVFDEFETDFGFWLNKKSI